ncbi:MAG: tRNA (adenosine(37)-N6)-dimethylallyltransferase MiaA [Candidatus Cryptobacteroides sp.]|nr:tRNA (adenosine(37)-N6)-dimethylallyltransferase MiaA [Candidatus Cryptobacteroides sp.]
MAKKSFTPIPPMAQLPQPEEIDIESILKAYIEGDIDLICILGPTASGKTRYAVLMAKQLNEMGRKAEIISADSRQVYRGMDIGTGKDLDEYGDIPYHLIDIANAGDKYNIYEYQKDFEKVYREIRERGNIPLLCGGSGLYIEAATCGYSLPEVPANPQLREELEKESTEALIQKLASLKPLHNSTDYDTRKRLIRALEIAIYESEHPAKRTSFLPKNTFYIGTLVSREVRNERIDRRLEDRLQEGMVDEIKRILDSGVPAEDLIYYGLEYKYVTMYLLGALDYDQMKLQLATAIHQFAKRQMTWFRGMERKGIRIHWTQV